MKTVLVVDDEKDIRETIAQGLNRHGYEASVAANGQEALDAANARTPDLILLDIAMPGIDGYETCALLKKDIRHKNVPIIFLTGKDLDPRGIVQRIEQLGAKGYLPKPSTLQELLDKVKRIIG